MLGGAPRLAAKSSHLVSKPHHAALVGFDLRQVKGRVSVEVPINQYFLHSEMCENWHYDRLGALSRSSPSTK